VAKFGFISRNTVEINIHKVEAFRSIKMYSVAFSTRISGHCRVPRRRRPSPESPPDGIPPRLHGSARSGESVDHALTASARFTLLRVEMEAGPG
jgi:hypothetical protein